MNDNRISSKQNNEVSHNLETKICNKCGRALPTNSFRLMDNKVSAPYYLGQCKECEYKSQRKYIESKQQIKINDNVEILIHRKYKEIKPERILDLSATKILPLGTDEQFVKLMDYKDYWISNYGRMIRRVNGQTVLLTGSYDKYGVLRYTATKNNFYNGKWNDKSENIYAPKVVVETFIVNPDIENNIYIWHGGFNKEDNYFRNLYPLNQEQYRIVKQNFMKNGDDSEAFIVNVMNDIRYKPDNWSKPEQTPTMCGVGYWGSDDVDCKSESYIKWHDMMNRCYNDKFHERQPQYKGHAVGEEWHNYCNFKIWYEKNKYGIESLDLDKDILFKGNTIYSSETCCLVPHFINTLFLSCKKNRGDLPLGVHRDKESGKYRAELNCFGKVIKLGTFNDSVAAFEKYKEYKEKFIKDMAERSKDKIPYKVYRAMMEWKIEIDD